MAQEAHRDHHGGTTCAGHESAQEEDVGIFMAGENWTQKAVKRHLGCRPDFLLLRDKREWDEPDPVRLFAAFIVAPEPLRVRKTL